MNSDRTAFLSELIQKAKRGFEHYRGDFDKLNAAYLLALDEDKAQSLKERGKANLFIPKINAKAKRITDALSETYFNSDEFAKLETYINSSADVIEKWQEALNHYTTIVRLYKVMMPMFQKIPFLGTSVAKVFWRKGLPVIEEVELDDIFFDPEAKDHDDIRYYVNRISLSYEDLGNLAKQKIYDKEATNELISRDEAKERRYDRLEIYDVYECENDKWYLSTIADNALLRDKVELKDGCPFILGYMVPQVRDFNEQNFICAYGEPPLASILPLQEEMNFARNSLIDAMNAHLKPKIVAPLSANISRTDLETIGKPIFTQNPAQITFVPPPNIGSAQINISLIDNEMSEASGVSPQQNGATTPRKETATMASIMANEGSVRVQGYVRAYNETFIEPLFERLAMLVWKYGASELFAGYSRDEVPSFKVALNTGIGALNKEVQKDGLMQASAALNAQFGLCMQIQDIQGAARIVQANEKIIRQILPLYGIKNVDEFLGDEGKEELNALIDNNTTIGAVFGAGAIKQQGAIPANGAASVYGADEAPIDTLGGEFGGGV